MLHISEINDFNQFLELRYTWDNVLDRCRDKHIFLTWEYLSTYWKHFRKETKLRIICVEDKNEIIGIAPLRQSRYSYAGLLSYDVIEPTAYRGLNIEGADYTGLILARRELECLRLFLDYLAKDDSWDFVYLMDFPETSSTIGLLSQMPNSIQNRLKIERGAPCPYMPLPKSIDTLLKTLGPKLRKNLRRSRRKLQNDFGKVEFKKFDELGSVEETMKIFFNLHQKRCESKGLPGVFATREVRDFYVDVARLFADNGWLALCFLTVNDEPIAGQYCFEYRNKMYYALGGFDPRYYDYSIGNLLCLNIVEKCVEKGLEEYDLLKGDEAYKFSWASQYRTNMSIKLVNQKLTSNFYDLGIRTLQQIRMRKILQSFIAYTR